MYRESALQMIPASQGVCKELPSRGTRRPYPSVVSSQSNTPYPENEPNGARAEDFRCFRDLQETRDDECQLVEKLNFELAEDRGAEPSKKAF